jgi:hypothetical protein
MHASPRGCSSDSHSLPGDDPRNPLQIGHDFNTPEPGIRQQCSNSIRLAIPNLHRQKSAPLQHRKSRGNQPPIKSQPSLAAKQRYRRLMLADFDGQRIPIPNRNIRRIGNHHLKPLVRNRRQQVALSEFDAPRNPVPLRIPARNLQRRAGNIDRVILALGSSRASATAIAPDPVPTSIMRGR